MQQQQYKIKIDKDALTEFFLSDGEVTERHLKEIRKVFNVVMIKHFSRYTYMVDDLFQYAILAILERRKSYDPSFSAYNYIYSCFRNEVGNKINKLTRENLVEDILSFKEAIDTEGLGELPDELCKYTQALIGTEDFTMKRIPKSDVLNIVIFLRLYESRRTIKVPNFIAQHKNCVQVLYRLLKEFAEI